MSDGRSTCASDARQSSPDSARTTHVTEHSHPAQAAGLRRAVALVAVLNLGYFTFECTIAQRIQSVSLFADSVDFFEDAAVNFLIFVALAWTAKQRARVGMVLAGTLILPAGAMLCALWGKLHAPSIPAPLMRGATGFGALSVNLACAFILAKFRGMGGSLTRAAFLSARNDVVANVAIISAGVITLAAPSAWPDLIVGLGVAWINLDAAKEVWQAARTEAADKARPAP